METNGDQEALKGAKKMIPPGIKSSMVVQFPVLAELHGEPNNTSFGWFFHNGALKS